MPIDSNIALGIRPVEVENPMNALAKMMQVQGLQQQNEVSRMAVDDKNAMNRLYRTAMKPDGTLDRSALLSGAAADGRGSMIPGLRKGFMEEDESQGKIDKQKVELLNLKTAQSREHLDMVKTPEQYLRWHIANHADPILGPALAARGITAEDSMKSIKEAVDSGNFEELLNKSRLGIAKFAELNKPTITTRSLGGTTDTLLTEGLTGKTTTVNSAKNTPTPGDLLASDDRKKARDQAQTHFDAGQSTPEYKETDAGLMALPKKLAPGQAPTGTLVLGADGQPLGKPLKAIPQGVNTAIIANSQATNQIDRALALIEGQDVGTMKGDKNATGVKAFAPNGVLNRLDPKGVDARAEISDIGSMKIHDRSGAAVTLSEAPRLMPFIPLATDDAATVKKKLTRLKTELANESTALQDTYSKDQGYKPSPVKPAKSAANAPTVTNW